MLLLSLVSERDMLGRGRSLSCGVLNDVERRSCTKYGLMPGSPLRGLGSVEVDPFVEVA